jgi:hypothetical protein
MTRIWHDHRLFMAAFTFLAFISVSPAMSQPPAELAKAVTFYASFDSAVRGDFGGGELAPSTRHDDPQQAGKFLFTPGIDEKVFRIAPGKGIHGGALEALDVLPRRGRIYFPAKGNLSYKPGGWGGSASYWVNTNPNTLLKTPFCDPIQITQKGASDGGIWTDFPDSKPRDFRLGIFPGLKEGEKAVPESDPAAPLVTVKKIDFESGKWRHVVMNWNHLDTGKPNAEATLYIDGKPQGALQGRELAMRWDLDHTGISFAVNYIGLLDELALFDRPLTAAEIAYLRDHPGELAPAK